MARKMITFRQNGNWDKTTNFLKKFSRFNIKDILKRYGEEGVALLQRNTPVDTGKTANSWYYSISVTKNSASLTFSNSNIVDGVPIAIILQYGHATNNGGHVEGVDYINPAIKPLFEDLASRVWEEVMH